MTPPTRDSVYTITLIAKAALTTILPTIESSLSDVGASVKTTATLSDGSKGLSFAEQLTVEKLENPEEFKVSLASFCQQNKLDLVVQQYNEAPIKLACFDMDSTLIKVEVIDELAKYANVGEQVAAITERAMQGELDFNQSFTERMRLLSGLDASVVKIVSETLPLMDGAQRLFKNLANLNIHTAILSGGFEVFAQQLQSQLQINQATANTLQVHNGALTGQVIAPIINADIKREKLISIREQLGIEASQTMAVGDGANDLKMLAAAQLGIAYQAKPLVQAKASAALNYNDLDTILFLLGLSQEQILL